MRQDVILISDSTKNKNSLFFQYNTVFTYFQLLRIGGGRVVVMGFTAYWPVCRICINHHQDY